MKTDVELTQAVASGDEAAFEELWERNVENVKGQIHQFYPHWPELRETTISNVMLQLHRKAHTFRGASKFSSWLYRVIHNECLMVWRKVASDRLVYLADVIPDLEDHGLAPDLCEDSDRLTQRLDAERRLAEIARVLEVAGDREREVCRLRFVDGLEPKQIAKHLRESVPAIKSRLHRIKAKMLRRLRVKGMRK